MDESISEAEIPLPKGLPKDDNKAAEKNREIWRSAEQKIKSADYDGALKILKDISETDKNGYAVMGGISLKIGRHEDAIRFLETAVEHNRNDFESRKLLAKAYYKMDNLDKSLINIEAGLSLKNDPELRYLYDKITREKRTQQKFIDESAGHFKLVYDGHEHGSISRKILSILDDAYRYVGKELDYFPTEPVTVILYTSKDFFDTTRAPGWAGGLYDGKIRLPVRGAEGQEALLKRVLYHEYVHSVVRSLTERCPLWINEGLAEYYSEQYPKKIGQAVPLKYLENSFAWLGGNVGVAYWESYSAVSYLIEKYGAVRMKELLTSLSKGADINKAFKDIFGMTYDEFVSTWGKG
jgi:tetratricopeptide (TPR) repeat protein